MKGLDIVGVAQLVEPQDAVGSRPHRSPKKSYQKAALKCSIYLEFKKPLTLGSSSDIYPGLIPANRKVK